MISFLHQHYKFKKNTRRTSACIWMHFERHTSRFVSSAFTVFFPLTLAGTKIWFARAFLLRFAVIVFFPLGPYRVSQTAAGAPLAHLVRMRLEWVLQDFLVLSLGSVQSIPFLLFSPRVASDYFLFLSPLF